MTHVDGVTEQQTLKKSHTCKRLIRGCCSAGTVTGGGSANFWLGAGKMRSAQVSGGLLYRHTTAPRTLQSMAFLSLALERIGCESTHRHLSPSSTLQKCEASPAE